jgi:hypothetical protein
MIKNIWKSEPALILGFVQAVLALAITFGIGLTVEQVGAILAASAALLGLLTRSQVTAPKNAP